jgi:hypothetical protein
LINPGCDLDLNVQNAIRPADADVNQQDHDSKAELACDRTEDSRDAIGIN